MNGCCQGSCSKGDKVIPRQLTASLDIFFPSCHFISFVVFRSFVRSFFSFLLSIFLALFLVCFRFSFVGLIEFAWNYRLRERTKACNLPLGSAACDFGKTPTGAASSPDLGICPPSFQEYAGLEVPTCRRRPPVHLGKKLKRDKYARVSQQTSDEVRIRL